MRLEKVLQTSQCDKRKISEVAARITCEVRA